MKKQKIVITGALGYIGSELCKLYSGETRYKDIIAIDNRFVSERISQLRSWGIRFIQADILDEQKMKEILHDTDVCYHLAGITDVAYTKTQENEEKDKLIREVGIVGTRNIANSVGDNTKIIFPSTHVVFEGLQETTFDILEEQIPCPVLTYSYGKWSSEFTIQQSKLKYVNVRLGSVYGYSTDTMRINIMPNLFSKIASQNGTISMYGGGVQYKSMVHVVDVVRAMKFLAESDHTGTYHLCNENMTVKEVAEICKEVNPEVTLIETDDEIPNRGYTLSNQKLLDTGFSFLYNIKDSIREMITQWSEKNTTTPDEYILKGGKEYIDHRGIIRNYELPEPINLIGYIESLPGTVRANHYHPIQEQKCLLIFGRYVSVTKDLSVDNAPIETRIINPGDVAVIRPNVAHAMVFLEDSIFLNLVRGEREHDNYGITHTIPYILVDEKLRDIIITSYKRECRVCGDTNLMDAVSLGLSPLANNLVDNPNTPVEKYPLEMKFCPTCHNCQLSVVVPAGKMFDNYLYVSSTSAAFRKHFEDAAEQYIKEFNLTDESLVIDIGSNDGVFLKPLKERGVQVLGIEPAANVAQIANDNGVPTLHSYMDDRTVGHILTYYGQASVVTASNVFAHSDDLVGMASRAFSLLNDNGAFIIEVQYLLDTIHDLTFDNIYHEHVNYWSVTALIELFNRLNLYICKVEHINTHGGSIRVYVKRDNVGIDSSVQQFLDKEVHEIKSHNTYITMSERIQAVKKQVLSNMTILKKKFSRIAAYGSPAKATTALNYYGITSDDIQYTIEDNTLKQGKYIPGVNIPIESHYNAITDPAKTPDVVIVLAWNFFGPIVEKAVELKEKGTIFISIKDLEKETSQFISLIDPSHASISSYLDCYQDTYKHLIMRENAPGGIHIKVLPYLHDIQNGFFVEVGAHNGIFQSNTRILEQCGWNGILVEPAKDLYEQCKQNRPNCIVEHRALIAENSTDDNIILMGSDEGYMKCTLTQLTEQYNVSHIDFLSLDVEGYEMEVLKGIDFSKIDITYLLIECNSDRYSYESLVDYMTAVGYKVIANISNFTKENTPTWPGNHQDYLFKKII